MTDAHKAVDVFRKTLNKEVIESLTKTWNDFIALEVVKDPLTTNDTKVLVEMLFAEIQANQDISPV